MFSHIRISPSLQDKDEVQSIARAEETRDGSIHRVLTRRGPINGDQDIRVERIFIFFTITIKVF